MTTNPQKSGEAVNTETNQKYDKNKLSIWLSLKEKYHHYYQHQTTTTIIMRKKNMIMVGK